MMQAYHLETIRAHVALMEPDTQCVHWDELKRGYPLSCSDARIQRAIVGFPGGDAGLFLSLVSSLRKYSGKPLRIGVLQHLFEEYLNHFGHFYLHTDAESLELLGIRLLEDARFARFEAWFRSWDKVHRFLVKEVPRDVSENLRRILLREHLIPAFQGCGHLSLVWQYARRYGVRKDDVRALLRFVFRALWTGDERIFFEGLEGPMEAGALLIARENKTSTRCPNIVALVPSFHGRKTFVYHPDAVVWMLGEAMHMIRGSGVPRALELHTLNGLQEVAQETASRHARLTFGILGKGLPVYTVTPDHDHLRVEPASL